MNEIIIGGYTLDELKVIQSKVKKDANKIIADAIASGTAYVEQILAIERDEDAEEYSAEQYAEMQTLAGKAQEQLEIAKIVSGLSDVKYYLEFSNSYDTNSDTLTYQLSDKFEDDYPDVVDELYGLLEDMEGDSYMWHNSNC